MSFIHQTAKTYKLGIDIASPFNCFVKFSASNTVVPCTVAGENAIGIMQVDQSSLPSGGLLTGDLVTVAKIGGSQVKAGGTIARGALISTDANGKAVAAANAAADTYALAQAEESCVAGDVFEVIIKSAVLPKTGN